jgi:predicted PhzF superfamily epimerase YddE/YHI9
MITLRVFCDANGEYGNPVGIVEDEGQKINEVERQKIALNSGYSEIVFIDDIKEGKVSIFTPVHQIPFAGHALVGTAHFLIKEYGFNLSRLISMGNEIPIRTDDKLTWVQVDLEILPKWNFEQLSTPSMVEEIKVEQAISKLHSFVWSWIDEEKGLVRARTFATDWGIPEDEATDQVR